MATRVLVVDDDVEIRQSVGDCLSDVGYETRECGSAAEALRELDSGDYDVVVSDIRMPSIDGVELCGRIATGPNIPVILMTAFAAMDSALEALHVSAFDFLRKPFSLSELTAAVNRAASSPRNRAVRRLNSSVVAADYGEFVGKSREMAELLRHLGRISTCDVTVLITGESGTGKDLVARAIHRTSARRDGPFVAMNCAAMPPELLESELFGHVSGAFTGAAGSRQGLLVAANGGTLFLDEIGAMPLALQPTLLRALQERLIRPVGGTREEHFDVRVVAATNEDLHAKVRRGAFREDLLFRLDVLPVHAPPLRERERDIVPLAEHFLSELASERGSPPLALSEETASRLLAHSWPGNVRELRNCMESAATVARGPRIEVDDLPAALRAASNRRAPAGEKVASLDAIQRDHIETVLRAVSGNKTEAARVLGIDRVTLYRRMKRFGPTEPAR